MRGRWLMDSKSSCRRQITQRSCQPENKAASPSRSVLYDYRSKSSDHRIAPLPGRGRPVFGTEFGVRGHVGALIAATCRRNPKNPRYRGSRNNASAPVPADRFISTNEPPCASAICRLNGRPIPEPSGLVVKKGTKRFAGFITPGPSS